MSVSTQARSRSERNTFLWTSLGLLVLAAFWLGAWWGFPVQDDVYFLRLLRMGGTRLVIAEHPDRPLCGALMAACAWIARGHKEVYIAIAILVWAALAAASGRLWRALFPEWSSAWPVVALATVSPILTRIQFSTVTTIFPVVLPVLLVVAGTALLAEKPSGGTSWSGNVLATVMVAAAIALSEYGLATSIAAAALLVVLGRWRSVVRLGIGGSIGYVVFRAISNVRARETTDPDVQLEQLFSGPWRYPLKVLSSVWYSMIGAWARAASEIAFFWDSKSTLLAGLVGLMAASAGVFLYRRRHDPESVNGLGRRLLAVFAAVVAGTLPAVIFGGWPAIKIFPSRFQLPIVAFASCAMVASLFAVSRSKYRPLVLSVFFFVAFYHVVLRAAEERSRQRDLERFGELLRPYLKSGGLVIVVVPDRRELMQQEILKAAVNWSAGEADRLWIERPEQALNLFGPRTGCRRLESLRLEPRNLRWPIPNVGISELIWAPSLPDGGAIEPYFSGCPPR